MLSVLDTVQSACPHAWDRPPSEAAAPVPAVTLRGDAEPVYPEVGGIPMKAIFGPNTPRVLQFLIRMRKLSSAEIDIVTRTWNKVNPVDRAEAWAHLQLATAANEEYPVMEAASAARRAAMDTARTLGRDDWAFWAAAWDAGAAITADDLAEGDYETLTSPLRTVMPALKRGRTEDWGWWVPGPRVGQPGQRTATGGSS